MQAAQPFRAFGRGNHSFRSTQRRPALLGARRPAGSGPCLPWPDYAKDVLSAPQVRSRRLIGLAPAARRLTSAIRRARAWSSRRLLVVRPHDFSAGV